jgi:endonuclease YncB( thermonuclease family)
MESGSIVAVYQCLELPKRPSSTTSRFIVSYILYLPIPHRVPRMGNVRGEGLEPWALESRDLLKTRLIGKRVGVMVEYEKIQASPSQPTNTSKRIFATVKALGPKETQGQGKNVALMLIMEGVATCVKHRDGEERSSEYDSYLMAEAEAASKGKGMHSNQPAPSSLSTDKTHDLTTGADCEYSPYIQHLAA